MKKTAAVTISILSAASFVALASNAFAQTPAPPPPPAPAAETSAMPSAIAPMAMPKAPDDMTGSVGFGVGLAANVELVGTTPDVALRYWLHDNLVLEPSFAFGVTKSTGVDTGWNFAPQLVVMWVPFRSTSTRLLVGGGLGFLVGKTPPATDTTFAINIPVRAGVEHFFTRWLSAGIAAGENFFSYTKTGTPYSMAFNLNTATLVGQLFFYTD